VWGINRKSLFALTAWLLLSPCLAKEELITSAHLPNGEPIPYVLSSENACPRYVLILFPGGPGNVDPRLENGSLVYNFKGNFLLRAREHFVDAEFATVAANASANEARMQGLLNDLARRFPKAKIYLVGTSRGTFDTMKLSGYLADKIAGVVHTASLSKISTFDARKYKNHHLVVHHRNDGCHTTPFGAAQGSHERYGNEFIAMEGGTAVGNPCGPRGHHGFNGIEAQTVEAIKKWIKKFDNAPAP
jgi:hypothetical protein